MNGQSGNPRGLDASARETPSLVRQADVMEKLLVECHGVMACLEEAAGRLRQEPESAGESALAPGNAPRPVMSLETRLNGLHSTIEALRDRLVAARVRFDRAV